jgi:alanyl-tRNA synthetase
MNSKEIRQKYLDFFKDKNHSIIPSASLLPENDASLLFVNSGMFPLVPYLAGEKHPAGTRLTNSQKCFRSEDINEVGDNRHNTFFEMLGNWSLGDYFKKEQLNWWYEFLVDVLKIDPSKLYQTVYVGDEKVGRDEESIAVLKDIFNKYGVKAELGPDTILKGENGPEQELDFSCQRIFAYKDKNWWQRGDAIGELGGPDSETFYDTGKKHDPKFGKHCHLNCDCGRFVEIGNSVFMQYKKAENGWQELKNKNVDFGGGLERLAMVTQEKNNVFETDLFIKAIRKIEDLSGKKYFDYQKPFEIIADHLKAVSFIIGDEKGVIPGNNDQGYVVRRLIRRAIRYGSEIDIDDVLWTKEIANEIIEVYSDIYPNLKKSKDFIFNQLDMEEYKFKRTLEKGRKEFDKIKNNLNGEQAFNLYQTYGFPIEMTVELANEKGLEVDLEGYKKELLKHQELSRTASIGKFKGGLADHSLETTKLHTASHLLIAALRKVLGDHVFQKGSNITNERLRLDFSHEDKISDEQLKEIEDLVNKSIKDSLTVGCHEVSLDEAKKENAMGVFDSKYGNLVRVYSVGDGDNIFSKEICGGPHVKNTNELGHFKILKEISSSKGIRRIKAILENN